MEGVKCYLNVKRKKERGKDKGGRGKGGVKEGREGKKKEVSQQT